MDCGSQSKKVCRKYPTTSPPYATPTIAFVCTWALKLAARPGGAGHSGAGGEGLGDGTGLGDGEGLGGGAGLGDGDGGAGLGEGEVPGTTGAHSHCCTMQPGRRELELAGRHFPESSESARYCRQTLLALLFHLVTGSVGQGHVLMALFELHT